MSQPKPAPRPLSHSLSEALFFEAQKVLVGGVNSPVRAFGTVGGTPLIFDHGSGSRVYDVDGNGYLDFVGSWGPLILGHTHPEVVAALQDQAARGSSFGMTTELEIELARKIIGALPTIENVRFVSSGTEAAMSALRLARAATGRNYVVKFEGCYHGHADSFLSQAGSGLATLDIPASPGVPEAVARLTLNVPFNNSAAVEELFAKHPGEIAAVIVEPIAANMGVVPPEGTFLRDLRAITLRDGALLLMDEVITGFRVAYGGAQSLFSIAPDITILGKIIGGGLPVAAYGGRRELMRNVAPVGKVYQAGTLSGNPLAMRAGIETLRVLEQPGFYEDLHRKSARLVQGLDQVLQSARLPVRMNSFGSLLTLFFTREPVRDFDGAKRSDTARFAAFFWEMLKRGVFLPPSQYEAWFVSAAHSLEDVELAVQACRESLAAVFG